MELVSRMRQSLCLSLQSTNSTYSTPVNAMHSFDQTSDSITVCLSNDIDTPLASVAASGIDRLYFLCQKFLDASGWSGSAMGL